MKKLSDEENLILIKEYKQSGLQVKDICSRLNISKRKYYRLYKLLNNPLYIKKKNTRNEIFRNDQKYIRIDNYRDFELYRGIVVEAITRIQGSEEVFQTRKLSSIELTQKNSQLMIDIQTIKDAIAYDKKEINNKINVIIDNSSDEILNEAFLERLKNNAWIIGYVRHLVEENEYLIANILNRRHATYNDLGFMSYEDEYKTDFIDILIKNIYTNFPFDNDDPGKNIGMASKFTKKNGELVKHYLLKYIQKPLLRYGIDYSNTLLNEYNFQKVSLEIDMTIPEDEQKKVIGAAIKELYSKNLLFGYSEFIGRTLIKDLEDLEFDSVHKGRRGKRHTSLSERVADVFYVYDARKYDISFYDCAELLSIFYEKKEREEYNVSDSTTHSLFAIISKFMQEFEKKYKIQPSSLSKEKADYKEQITEILQKIN